MINLGAGFDTLYWRLKETDRSPANFIELDFPSVTARKCYHIKKHRQLIDMLNTEGGVSNPITFLPCVNCTDVGVSDFCRSMFSFLQTERSDSRRQICTLLITT